MQFRTDSIASSIHEYLNDNKAFVFYRKNNSEKVIALVQKDNKLYTTSKYDETGFVMAPFNCSNEAVLFPCDKTEKFSFDIPIVKTNICTKDYDSDSGDEQKYLELVQKTIDFINNGNANKVVTSRKIEKDFDRSKTGAIFEILLNTYPDTMAYIWHHPKVGMWIGATPEKMLYVHKESFSTMSLAGTQLKSDTIKWPDKEKTEQQWVTDFITDQLIPISSHLDISNPYTFNAGHLAHIRTDIDGDLARNISLKDLIFKIHPTPAVCGAPRNRAKQYILDNEGYERAFYTGFLGELNLHDNTDLYVNLRCMELKDTSAIIYIGGGITMESIPEKEWEETYQKSLVLARLL